MEQLHLTECQTTTTPPLPNNTPYTQFVTAHWKSINYSHNNKRLHFHSLTTHDPSTASQETSGCPAAIPHCSAFHYLKQPMSTTTTQLHSTLQLATPPTTSSSIGQQLLLVSHFRTVYPLHKGLHFLHEVSTTQLLPSNYTTSTNHLQGGIQHDYLHRHLQPEE